ncbi:MAG: hypothetical protein WCV99_22575 [Sterolibacterium sp.]|jgi:hypothetical protein
MPTEPEKHDTFSHKIMVHLSAAVISDMARSVLEWLIDLRS